MFLIFTKPRLGGDATCPSNVQHLLELSLAKIKELEDKLKENSGSSGSTTPELRRTVPLVDICTPLKAGFSNAKKPNLATENSHIFYIWGCIYIHMNDTEI